VRTSFISPVGSVVVAKLVQPFYVDEWRIWFADLSFPNGWEWPANGREPNVWRFVTVSTPAIYDAHGKPLGLLEEVGAGSLVRIAGQHFEDGRRTVLTIRQISIVKFIEAPNPFMTMESARPGIGLPFPPRRADP
jgi:hypothetical protein